MLVLGIILFLAALYWDVETDYQKWLNNQSINHGKEVWVRALALTPSTLCFFFSSFHLYQIPMIILMLMAWWWELFDGLYNIRRDQKWRFNGTNDNDDAKADDFLQKLKPWQQAVLKWSLIALFTTIYIINY